MYFLHNHPRIAAISLADNDLNRTIKQAHRALSRVHKKLRAITPLDVWANDRADNYAWLATFAFELQVQISVRTGKLHKLRSDIINLRTCIPLWLLWKNNVSLFPYKHATDPIASSRYDYIGQRRRNTKWTKVSAPGWYVRAFYQVPSKRPRSYSL